ncbi:AAA family ATPase [Treponema sp.]|uniref:AAA family ATPase n=1 Tax=Treponema sp. TaxID=166 RepID=UPI003F07E626
MDELFSSAGGAHEPLAARMRPRTLDEYIGQEHIVGKGRLLRRAIAADQLTSVIFYGPPGTGKTTLARVVANHTSSNFITLNAVLTGVADIRKSISDAETQKNLYKRKTILFVDEVHRWNKSQQDALLPWVENGTFILIGATTENPFFEVNKALVSRSRVFQLKPLTKTDLLKAAHQALSDTERGYGKWKVEFEQGALEHLIETANGDARSLLNALELAVETTPEKWPPSQGSTIYISREACEESIQKKVVLYDRDGDYHYDIISAFIKSLRGRDPDAACYWLARMVKAGEDPHFIFRRMLISACEDTGLADPNAVSIVESCAAAFDRVGLPEGRYFLTHAALYLATAPKSNSAMAFFDALSSVEKEDADVPNHLRDASRDAEGFGHGAGYLYPHAYKDHWIAQQYLPDSLVGKVFYTPSTQGYEAAIRKDILSRREAQIASILEDSQPDETEAVNAISDWWKEAGHFHGLKKTGENLTFTAENPAKNAALKKGEALWRARLETNRAQTLLGIRNAMTEAAGILRFHRCLVANADDALLLFDLIRKTPEGIVCGICRTQAGMESLLRYAATLEDLDQPKLCLKQNSLRESVLSFGDIEFDRFFARDIFSTQSDIEDFCASVSSGFFGSEKIKRDISFGIDEVQNGTKELFPFFEKSARIVVSQRIPCAGQHLTKLIEETLFAEKIPSGEIKKLLKSSEQAETEFFGSQANPLFSWNEETVKSVFERNGFSCLYKTSVITEKRKVSPQETDKWFSAENSSYGKFMENRLGQDDFKKIKELFLQASEKNIFSWKTKNALFIIEAPGETTQASAH